MRASSRLHDRLFSAVMRAPVSFFDLTPRGRVVNRFSRDMDESTSSTQSVVIIPKSIIHSLLPRFNWIQNGYNSVQVEAVLQSM